jgi:hypothetical protein
MREIWFALFGALSMIAMPSEPALAATGHPALADAQSVLELTKNDRILGDPAAPITILEYA